MTPPKALPTANVAGPCACADQKLVPHVADTDVIAVTEAAADAATMVLAAAVAAAACRKLAWQAGLMAHCDVCCCQAEPLRTSYTVISTGTMSPAILAVCALYSLQNAMMFTPCKAAEPAAAAAASQEAAQASTGDRSSC